MVTQLSRIPKPQIMIVDDSKVVRWSITKILGEKYSIHAVESAESAWNLLQAEQGIVLVFCDLQMPGMDGYQFLRQMRSTSNPRFINLPIIIISGEEDTEDLREQLLKEGATDFVLKPFDASMLCGRVAAYVNYQQQIMQLEQDTELDPISGLAGRNYFQLHAERNITLALRHNIEFTLAVLEIDHYQQLLEKLGSKVFLQLLFQVGKRIKGSTRVEDLTARIDQARFGLVFPMTNSIGGRLAIERVCNDLDCMVLKYAGEQIKFSVSAGMSEFETGCKLSVHELIGSAEQALRQAISAGGNQVVGYAKPYDIETEEPASKVGIDRSIELIRHINAGKVDEISEQQMSQLLLDIRPVLELADRRMKIGLTELLEHAYKQIAKKSYGSPEE